MPVIAVFIHRHCTEVPGNNAVQAGVNPEVALQHYRQDALSVYLIAGIFHFFTGSVEAFLCLYVLLGNSQRIHDFLIEHDTAVAALFHYVNPYLIIGREYLPVILGFHMAGIRIPAAVGICQSLLDILREVLEQMGFRIIGFQEGFHIPYLVRCHKLLIYVRIRNGHHIRKLS